VTDAKTHTTTTMRHDETTQKTPTRFPSAAREIYTTTTMRHNETTPSHKRRGYIDSVW
jgi:hypothetical protein